MLDAPRLSRPAAAFLVAGGALRVVDWLGNRSLWHDEAALALNLLERDWRGLLAPLDYGQMAPPGFLAASELVAGVFGHGELVLRALPLLVALAALPLFGAWVRRVAEGPAQWLACALFALSAPMVHYAAEFKPYGGDVTAGLAVMVLGLRAREAGFDLRGCAALGAVGALLPWFSFGSLFVMAGVGIALGVPLLRRERAPELGRLLATVAVPWIASLGLLYGLFLSRMIATPFMQNFWHFSFMPFPPASAADWLWLPERLRWVFERSAGLDPGWLMGGLALLGALVLARRSPTVLAMFALPPLLALVASALHVYPFFQRFLFFLVPAVCVAVAQGGAALVGRILPARPTWALGLVALLVWPTWRTAEELRLAWRPFGLEPVLGALAARRSEDETLYVYHGAEYVFRYYQERLAAPALEAMRLGGSPFTSDQPRRAWKRWHSDEAATFGAGRAWIVFTNVRAWGGRSDEERLLAELARRGQRLDRIEAEGASATLIELER